MFLLLMLEVDLSLLFWLFLISSTIILDLGSSPVYDLSLVADEEAGYKWLARCETWAFFVILLGRMELLVFDVGNFDCNLNWLLL